MNFLSRIANDEKAASALVFIGVALGTLAEILIFTGAHYQALHKGVEIRDDYYFEKEKKAYEEKYGKICS